MPVTAVYELPVPIWVTSSTLGKRFASGRGGVEWDVMMPADQPPHGAPPAIDGIEARPDLTEEDTEWASDQYGGFVPESLRPAVLLIRVGLTNVTAPPHPYRSWAGPDDQLVDVVDAWFDSLRTWVEVVTGQDLDPRHRVYAAEAVGSGLTFIDPPHDGALGMTITTPSVRPVRAIEWAGILSRVRADTEPPLEEVLSRDARAAQARGSNRRAIIDAATALEIVLGRHVRQRAEQLPDRQRGRLTDRTALGDYIAIAKASGLDLAVSFDALEQLKTMRNSAAHRGEAPGSWETAQAVQTMIDFLGVHGPFRRTASDEPDGSEWIVADSSEA